MKTGKLLGWLGMAVLLVAGCTKELSYEGGLPGTGGGGTAQGSLPGAPAGCLNFQLRGDYAAGLPLDTSHRAVVEANISQTGSYSITTDTVNGMWFRAEGNVAATGNQPIVLQGFGTPVASGTFTMSVRFLTTTCTFTVRVFELAQAVGNDYFPTTTGSNWRLFSNDPSALDGDTARMLSTGQTITLLGNSYNIFTIGNPPDLDSAFYRKGGGEYREIGDLDIAGIASNFVIAEWIFLKDNVPAGTTWLSPEGDATVSGSPTKIRREFTILEKSVNVIQDNKLYRDVIKVRNVQQVQVTGGVWQNVITWETWYARGIGLINLAVAAPVYGYRITRHQIF